ncbi:MAG: amino acid dehydrogenase [Robiginitomaculum sp.]|nr:MAG: amino acid dehydrogenase [Robiginitomaculum sp.]
MSVFEDGAFRHHESVHFFSDEPTGMQAIIAIHSTDLGPALGGCRMVNYANSAEALTDVLRLSRGMSLKNSLAGLELGGGKSVLMVPAAWGNDPKYAGPERASLFQAFGHAVDSLGGRYIAAEDMNISVEDAANMGKSTRHVVGLETGMGDPSPLTADGVFFGMRACIARAFGTTDFTGLTIAVQGLGKVGWRLCEQLHKAGAKLIVADIVDETLQRAKQQFGAVIADKDGIVTTKCDVFAPCARGGVINAQTLGHLQTKVIAGSANNQLSKDELGAELQAKGILYAPDFVINAGGVINIAPEVNGVTDHKWVAGKVAALEQTVGEIIDRSIAENRSTNQVADEIASARILNARHQAAQAA